MSHRWAGPFIPPSSWLEDEWTLTRVSGGGCRRDASSGVRGGSTSASASATEPSRTRPGGQTSGWRRCVCVCVSTSVLPPLSHSLHSGCNFHVVFLRFHSSASSSGHRRILVLKQEAGQRSSRLLVAVFTDTHRRDVSFFTLWRPDDAAGRDVPEFRHLLNAVCPSCAPSACPPCPTRAGGSTPGRCTCREHTTPEHTPTGGGSALGPDASSHLPFFIRAASSSGMKLDRRSATRRFWNGNVEIRRVQERIDG